MKKFYEAPAVEFTGFSAEDVITTSVGTINLIGADQATVESFTNAVRTEYGQTTPVENYGTYTW